MTRLLSIALSLLALTASLQAGEPLRFPAEPPALEKRDNWQQSLNEIYSAGIPRDWLLIGPVKDQNFKLFDSDKKQPAELSDDWTNLGAKAWTRPRNEEGCEVDLSEALNGRYDVLGFAQTEIIWPVDGPALIWFDSLGRAAIFLNNTRVETGPPRKRALDPGSESLFPIEVQMKRGRNVLKVKCGQDRNPYFKSWGFSIRIERNDVAFMRAQFEMLSKLYPDEAAGLPGAEGLLEIARLQEKAGETAAASTSYETVLKKIGGDGNTDYQAEAEAGRQRCQQAHKDDPAAVAALWKKTETQCRALLMDGSAHAANLILRDFIAKNPFHDATGTALTLRGALYLDYSHTQPALSLLGRALREFPNNESVRNICLPAIALARSFRPDKIDVDVDHEVQNLVDGMRRQMRTGFPHDIEAAAKIAAELVRAHPDSILRISDTKSFPRYAGLREYVRALLATFPAESLEAYQKALAQVSLQEYNAARALDGILELEAVAWNYYYTPAAARALNDLGNLYMDRGADTQALFAFKLLQRDYGRIMAQANDARLSAPMIAAKIAYLLSRSGSTGEAAEAITRLATEYGSQSLVIGNQKTSGADYARALQARLENREVKSVQQSIKEDAATFGGGINRAGAAAANPADLKSGASAWNETLPRSACANVARDYWPEDTAYAHLQSHPVISGDRAFVSTLESLQAFDLGSGKKLWHQTWESRGSLFDDGGRPLFTGHPVSCPTVSERKVFVRALQARQTSLRCYDAENGKLVWSSETNTALKKMVWISEPLVAYGLVVGVYLENPFQLDIEPAGRAPSNTHGVAALDAETGELRWKRPLTSGSTGMRVVERMRGRGNKEWATYRSTMQLGPPAADNGIVYTQTGLSSVAALNAFTGELIWLSGYPGVKSESLEWGNAGMEKFMPRVLKLLARGPASPVVGEEIVVVSPKDAGGVFAFEREGGRIRWMNEVLDCRFLAGICDGKLLAVDDTVSAISMKTGKTEWEFTLPNYSSGLYAQPGFFSGLLYLPTKENLQVIDARSGKALTPVTWDPKIGALANLAITPQYAIGVNGKVIATIPVGAKP